MCALYLAELTLRELSAGGLPLDEGTLWIFSLYLLLGLVGLAVDVWIGFYLLSHPVKWDRDIAWIKARPWRWIDGTLVFLILLFMFTSLMVAGGVFAGDADAAGSNTAAKWVMIQSVGVHWFALALVAVLVVRRGHSWVQAFGLNWSRVLRDARTGLLFYLAVLPVFFFYAACYEVFRRFTGHAYAPQDVVEIFYGVESRWLLVYLILLAVVIAPLAEEFIFRGIGLPVLARSWGLPAAVLAVSVAFALLHGHASSLVPLFVLAVAFSLSYVHTRSILVPIFMHALFNGVNLGLLLSLKAFG